MITQTRQDAANVGVRLIKPDELSGLEIEAWVALQCQGAPLQSPFLHPEFVLSVSRVRSDVEVAVMEQNGKPVGFFPFQRDSNNVGWPVAAKLSDFHGVVASDGVPWCASRLVQQCGLRAWHFDHLVGTQHQFSRYRFVSALSPYLDLKAGWQAYSAEHRQGGSLKSTLRKARKIEREVGRLRFEFQTGDENVFSQLVEWKSAQHRRTQSLEVFRFPWVLSLLRNIQAVETPSFAGNLSALYAGRHLVAVHLGMRTSNTFHIWFPAYDRTFARYSPGLILLVRLAQDCCERGITRLDLGKGPERYKQSLKSSDIPLAEGAVSCRSLDRVLHATWYVGRAWLRTPRLRPLVRIPKRIIRKYNAKNYSK